MNIEHHGAEHDAPQETIPPTRKKRRYGAICFLSTLGVLLTTGITLFAIDYFDSHAELSQAPRAVPTPLMIDFHASFEKLRAKFGLNDDEVAMIVDVSEQQLLLLKNGTVVKSYPVSTSVYGIGNKSGSDKTPLGAHRISEKIGAGAPIGAVFRSRVHTGEVAPLYTDQTDVKDDLVTTRILWLNGLEPGINKGKGIDSHARCIYIHGTQEEGLIGKPASHGCVRMKNQDVVDLFDLVSVGTLVEIQE